MKEREREREVGYKVFKLLLLLLSLFLFLTVIASVFFSSSSVLTCVCLSRHFRLARSLFRRSGVYLSLRGGGSVRKSEEEREEQSFQEFLLSFFLSIA